MQVGIESAAFYTPPYFLDLGTLAAARGVMADKYHVGLGINQMAVSPPDEDVVTLGANAALTALATSDKAKIRLLLFATESGIDQSKSAGLYVHRLLGLSPQCRIMELKQACYSATGGLMLAQEWLKANPEAKALIIAADIARYGLGMPGEPSQGAGAVALVLSCEPKLVSFEAGTGLYAEDAMDFWRPNYRDEALVEGKYSVDLYLKALKEAWQDYVANTKRRYQDHDHFLFHIPFPRLAEKALQKLALVNALAKPTAEAIKAQLEDSLAYSRTIGNCYTASLYLGLISLLEHRSDLTNQRLGLYSYGSGCMAEFFSMRVLPDYKRHLRREVHQQLLAQRTELDQATYEAYYSFVYPTDGRELLLPKHTTGAFRLAGLRAHQRIYEPAQYQAIFTQQEPSREAFTIPAPKIEQLEPVADKAVIKARAPGKLIITGEHAVVYGVPAIAIAIDRYCETEISPNSKAKVLFNLVNIDHKRERTLKHLKRLKSVLQQRHHEFIKGRRSIKEVLREPFHLLEYTSGALIDKLNLKFHEGFTIDTRSNIAPGCGMGSSAAAIVSLNYALSHYLAKPLTIDELFALNLAAENLQHGRSSGLDLQVSMQGGCIYFKPDALEQLEFPDWPLSIINTGTPEASTGQCIAHAQPYFNDPLLLSAFEAVSQRILAAIQTRNFEAMSAEIHRNHLLLRRIGVVPDPVHQLVLHLYRQGVIAKLSGAGSIEGEAAGVLLVLAETARVNAALASFGSNFKAEPIHIAPKGVSLI